MLTIVYLLLGVAFMGGLFWALTQITARQRKLNAELARLERLARGGAERGSDPGPGG
jgi:hypothetical protein